MERLLESNGWLAKFSDDTRLAHYHFTINCHWYDGSVGAPGTSTDVTTPVKRGDILRAFSPPKRFRISLIDAMQVIRLTKLNIDLQTSTLSFDWRKALCQLFAAESHYLMLAEHHGHSPRWYPSPQHFLRKSKQVKRHTRRMYRTPNLIEDQDAMEQYEDYFINSKEAETDEKIWQQVYEKLRGKRKTNSVTRGLPEFRRERIISDFL